MKKTSDNGYFIISPDHDKVVVEKAHFCTWNLPNGLEFLEVGMLVQLKEAFYSGFERNQIIPRLKFKVHIPWYEGKLLSGDLFSRLKDPENARFVFNEQVAGTEFISDGGSMPQGILFSLRDKQQFCLLPVALSQDYDNPNTVSAEVSFPQVPNDFKRVCPRIYFRFFVKSNGCSIPWKHGGIAKTVFCYDVKVNEPRNAPEKFPLDQLVEIRSCYCLHIIPTAFECSLQDRVAFKSIRTLEATEATAYLNGVPAIATTIKSGKCLVVFNKLRHDENPTLPFSFFTVFSVERIGPSQLALAIGANIGCGLLASWTWIASLVFLALVILVVGGISLWNRFGARIRSSLGFV